MVKKLNFGEISRNEKVDLPVFKTVDHFDEGDIYKKSRFELAQLQDGCDVRGVEFLKHSLRIDLFKLITPEGSFDVKKILETVKINLVRLKKIASDDPDAYVFGEMYQDLMADFTNKRPLMVDTTLKRIAEEMPKFIRKTSVKAYMPMNFEIMAKEMGSRDFIGIIDAFRAVGINPAYAVVSKNPRAKTVVLLLESKHAKPVKLEYGIADSEELTHAKQYDSILRATAREFTPKESNGRISKIINLAYKQGLSRDFYDEGVYNLINGSEKKLTNLSGELSNFKLRGYDCEVLKQQVKKGDTSMWYRATAHNVFMASNLAESMGKSSEKVAIVTVGSAHELFPNQDSPHPLPISDALAFYGMNVIVVDAAYSGYDYRSNVDF